MTHIGTLRDFKFKGPVDDIRGANLFGARNEKLGKVDDVVFDHAGGAIQYLVVDTGGWLHSRKFLVPADRVNLRTDSRDDFTCDLTKDQIEGFPEYKDSIIRSESDWQAYEDRYRASYSSAGDVLHREGSDHLVTPEATELPPVRGDLGIDVTPTRLVNKFSTPEPLSDKTRLRPAGTASRVEDSKMPGRPIENERAEWTEQTATPRNRRATDRRDDEEVIIPDREASRFERMADPGDARNDPPSYRASGRYTLNPRLADFEETLRRNRIDITSSCRQCGVEREELDRTRKDDAA